MRLLVHGSGFKSPFPNAIAEMRCGHPKEIGGDPECTWSPSNPDFESLGRTSKGGSTGVASLTDLADLIERQPIGSIDELRIIGHSNSEFFALGGTILTHDPNVLARFDEGSMMGESATFLGLQSRFHRLRNRFAEKGTITLAGCGSGGTNEKLLKLVSRAFLCCVEGFQNPITYGLDIKPAQHGPNIRRIGPGWSIADRGRVGSSDAIRALEERLGPKYIPISMLSNDAWTLKPDAISCAGQEVVDAAKRANVAQVMSALGSATEVGWRILKLFFPDKMGLFSGVSGDATLQGLGFNAQARGGMLIVGTPYAQLTSPATIDQRVSEMGELVKLAELGRSGTVRMR